MLRNSIFILVIAMNQVLSQECHYKLDGENGKLSYPVVESPTKVPAFVFKGEDGSTECVFFTNADKKILTLNFKDFTLGDGRITIKTIKLNPRAKWKIFRQLSETGRRKPISIKGFKYVKITVEKGVQSFQLEYTIKTPPVINCPALSSQVKTVKCSKGTKTGSRCSFTCADGHVTNSFIKSTGGRFTAMCKKITAKTGRWKPTLKKSVCGVGRKMKKECKAKFDFCVPIEDGPSIIALKTTMKPRRRVNRRRRLNKLSTTLRTTTVNSQTVPAQKPALIVTTSSTATEQFMTSPRVTSQNVTVEGADIPFSEKRTQLTTSLQESLQQTQSSDRDLTLSLAPASGEENSKTTLKLTSSSKDTVTEFSTSTAVATDITTKKHVTDYITKAQSYESTATSRHQNTETSNISTIVSSVLDIEKSTRPTAVSSSKTLILTSPTTTTEPTPPPLDYYYDLFPEETTAEIHEGNSFLDDDVSVSTRIATSLNPLSATSLANTTKIIPTPATRPSSAATTTAIQSTTKASKITEPTTTRSSAKLTGTMAATPRPIITTSKPHTTTTSTSTTLATTKTTMVTSTIQTTTKTTMRPTTTKITTRRTTTKETKPATTKRLTARPTKKVTVGVSSSNTSPIINPTVSTRLTQRAPLRWLNIEIYRPEPRTSTTSPSTTHQAFTTAQVFIPVTLNSQLCKQFCIRSSSGGYARSCSLQRSNVRKQVCMLCRYSPSRPCTRLSIIH